MGIINNFFGAILNFIFNGVTMITPLAALGISIVLFTLVTRILLTPLQLSSQRTSRGLSKIQPEIQRIQNKYKDKKDQESQMKMSAEMQALYKKYKINPFAGCLPLLIQFPLLIALFNVLRQPAHYIAKLGVAYQGIADVVVQKVANYQTLLAPYVESVYVNSRVRYDLADSSQLPNFLSHLTSIQWSEFLGQVGTDVAPIIQTALETKQNYETFLGVNVVDTPALLMSNGMWLAILVPIIAGASTFIFSKITMAANAPQQAAAGQSNPTDSMMKTMNIVMPVMTAFMSYSMPIGLALYWISGNVIMMGQQWIVNKMLQKQDLKMEEQLKREREEELKNKKIVKKKVIKKVPVQKQPDNEK